MKYLIFGIQMVVSLNLIVDPSAQAAKPLAEVTSEPKASSSGLQVWPESGVTPDFSLHDLEGKVRARVQFQGRVLVILFGFTHCASVCPTELLKIADALKKLKPQASAKVDVGFVTLDPEHDTPPSLKKFLARFNKRFIGLRGTPLEVNGVAKNFFVQHSRLASGDDYTIEHSTGIYFFDAGGKLRFVGTSDSSTDEIRGGLELLSKEALKKH